MPAEKLDQMTEKAIHRLVDNFYEKIWSDPELGPIFLRAIPGDGDPHLAMMHKFWPSVVLTWGRYKAAPVTVHRQVAGIEIELFDRWLMLFHHSVDAVRHVHLTPEST